MTESRRGREGKNSLHNASQKMYGMKTQIHPRNMREDQINLVFSVNFLKNIDILGHNLFLELKMLT